MLYQIFPKHIADALKAGETPGPESHDLVTIVYSDIVHFTDISSSLPPMKICNMLDRLYICFDKVAEVRVVPSFDTVGFCGRTQSQMTCSFFGFQEFGVFKIETVGDAYVGKCLSKLTTCATKLCYCQLLATSW